MLNSMEFRLPCVFLVFLRKYIQMDTNHHLRRFDDGAAESRMPIHIQYEPIEEARRGEELTHFSTF